MMHYEQADFEACDASIKSTLNRDLANYLPPILHFESSSLTECSYPVSVGLCYEGQSHYWEIRPRDCWVDWDIKTQNLHGLTRERLMQKGLPVCVVREEMCAILGSQETAIYSDTPTWDRLWLSQLGVPNPVAHINLLIPRKLRRTFYRSFLDTHERYDLTHYHAQHDALALALTLTLLLDRVGIDSRESNSLFSELRRVSG